MMIHSETNCHSDIPCLPNKKSINLLFSWHVTSPSSILVSYNHILRFPPSNVQNLLAKGTRVLWWWNLCILLEKGKSFCHVRLDIRRRCWLLIDPVPTALLCPYIVHYSVHREKNLSQIQYCEDPGLLGCDAVLLG